MVPDGCGGRYIMDTGQIIIYTSTEWGSYQRYSGNFNSNFLLFSPKDAAQPRIPIYNLIKSCGIEHSNRRASRLRII